MKRFPDHLIRLLVPLVVIIAALIIAKRILTPSSFGQEGHYRRDAIKDVTAKEKHYAGQEVCADCHQEIIDKKTGSYHKGVSCEVCHGPALEHTEDPGEHPLPAPRERGFCPLCHSYNPSRPTGFPQIVTAIHNPGKACITCHDPHDPTPLEVPKECGACHGDIERTKMVSSHANVSCTVCHETPEEHKIHPRAARPTKPPSREFCGGCHAKEAPSPQEIPRVDMSTHGERYVCWECHYPHLPEAYTGVPQ